MSVPWNHQHGIQFVTKSTATMSRCFFFSVFLMTQKFLLRQAGHMWGTLCRWVESLPSYEACGVQAMTESTMTAVKSNARYSSE